MARLTVIVGELLFVLGLAGYFMSGMASATALIPSAFGLVLSVLGMLARAESRRKTMMHTAMVVAVLGIIGSIGGLFEVPALLMGGDVERPAATVSKAVMAVLLIPYLTIGIRSFVQARRDTA